MKKLTTLQVKRLATNILCDFATFCDSHNLKYYLGYGTLLGAIRHKGFIPWDDDIDVMMTREDYEKLGRLLDESPIKQYLEWRSFENGKWIAPFAKIVDLRTSASAYGGVDCGGVWIDVFPMDNYNPMSYKKVKFLRNVFIAKGTSRFSLTMKGMGKMLYKVLSCPFPASIIAGKIRNISVNTPVSGCLANMCWATYRNEILDMAMFQQRTRVMFEGYEFWTVANPDQYLSLCYGDYMKIPPENKRIAHFLDAYWLLDSDCEI